MSLEEELKQLGMRPILVNIPKGRIMQLDVLVEHKEFPNRNEAIREAIRCFVV